MGGLLWGAEIENSDERNGLTVENFLLWGPSCLGGGVPN
jgi:hypothetical protein